MRESVCVRLQNNMADASKKWNSAAINIRDGAPLHVVRASRQVNVCVYIIAYTCVVSSKLFLCRRNVIVAVDGSTCSKLHRGASSMFWLLARSLDHDIVHMHT